ncbi:MAG: ATP-dependent DNA ligase [Euryarchaeota archaeon]|nr:ATP-dependent DNA ligase [Euryarchaeota archaeon]
MRFADLVDLFERISATTKRLEIRALLAEHLRGVSESDIAPMVYLLQGQLRPEYEGVELGLADSLARRALAQATGTPEETVRARASRSGDLGTTAEELLRDRTPSPADRGLTLSDVYQELTSIARSSGEGSQEAKVERLSKLLGRATAVEAKYLTRFTLGKLRLGVKDMTLLDALAEVYGGGEPKQARPTIENAFNVTSDLGEVASTLARQGTLEALRSLRAQVGKPIRPMLGEREATLKDVLERMEGQAALEYKYDGLRLQAHVPRDETEPVLLFSRRLENVSSQFPEIVRDLPKALKVRPAIVEGECVPVDPTTGELRPFQEISRRRGRKYDLERFEEEVPVRFLLFDLLLEGEEQALMLPYPERRARLERDVKAGDRVGLATRAMVEDVPAAQRFFDQALADGCEGVMAKSLAPGSTYRAGARGFWWIKYKREYTHELADTIDTVVVGAFWGRGKRAGRYGALLVSVFDPKEETFPTLCKVGTGFDDSSLERFTNELRSKQVKDRPEEVVSTLTPDVWIDPSTVLELRGAELTLSPIHRAALGRVREGYGLALRFPRFTGRVRDDKSPEQATTTDEVVHLYETQVRRAESESSSEGSEIEKAASGAKNPHDTS